MIPDEVMSGFGRTGEWFAGASGTIKLSELLAKR